MNFAVFGIPTDLRNRTLHIHWKEPRRHNDVSEVAKRHNDVLETPLSFSECLSLKEMAVIRQIQDNPTYTPPLLQQLSDLVMRRNGSEYSTIAGHNILSIVESEVPKRNEWSMSVFYIIADNYSFRISFKLTLPLFRASNLEYMFADSEICDF